ncbi:copper resistance CopC family protein [Streptomyces olivaceus]|uniref:copper resistance CopC family protein n=1 Tax=Streptomyces olivaceus TaxID=47716 RepID=UPI001CCB2F09|nr:copper resistance CopC family protein [Streptomyces olivaceus]
MTAPQAAAHTDLESSSPGADATLAGLPPRVTLTFSDPMTEKYAKVAVTTADGTSAAQGEPQVSGQQVTLALNSTAPSGRYTVGYRVVSADGHPVSGSYTFTVKDRTAAASPPGQVPAPAPAPESPKAAAANASDGGDSGATVLLVGGTGALVVGVGAASVFATRRRRSRRGD